MTYPNAAKGVKKLLTAEILGIIMIGLTLIVAILTVAAIASQSSALIGVVGALAIVLAILAIVALIIRIIGISSASKDEPGFKIALYAVIGALVISFLNGFIGAFVDLGVFKSILTVISNILELVCFIYCIIGIRSLADRLEHPEISNLGKNLLYIVIGVGAVRIILSLVESFIGTTASNIIAIVVAILGIVQEVMFIMLLVKAKKMLEEN